MLQKTPRSIDTTLKQLIISGLIDQREWIRYRRYGPHNDPKRYYILHLDTLEHHVHVRLDYSGITEDGEVPIWIEPVLPQGKPIYKLTCIRTAFQLIKLERLIAKENYKLWVK